MATKLVDSTQLDSALTSTANAIRAKTGKTSSISWNMSTGFAAAISDITVPYNQTKTGITPLETAQTITYDSGYTGLNSVQIAAISPMYVGTSVSRKAAATYTPKTTNQTIASGYYLTGVQTIAGSANLTAANIKSGVALFGVTGTYTVPAISKTTITLPVYLSGALSSSIVNCLTAVVSTSVPNGFLGNNGGVGLISFSTVSKTTNLVNPQNITYTITASSSTSITFSFSGFAFYASTRKSNNGFLSMSVTFAFYV